MPGKLCSFLAHVPYFRLRLYDQLQTANLYNQYFSDIRGIL